MFLLHRRCVRCIGWARDLLRVVDIGMATSVEVYAKGADVLGEGPMWSSTEQVLYWIDIAKKKLHRQAPGDRDCHSWSFPDHPGCLGELAGGSVAVMMGEGLYQLDLATGARQLRCEAPPRRPGIRFNDGKVDPRGRFWAGTMKNNFGPNGEPVAVDGHFGAVYRFDPNGQVRTVEENIGIANTFAWSPDLKRFYFADSLVGEIYAYDFDPEAGVIRNKRTFFGESAPGIPDGSAMDVDGCLWNARWDGRAILRITPEGTVDRTIELPVLRPTCCIFGGAELNTLYVTSATFGLSPQQIQDYPLSGSVFAIRCVGQGMRVPALA